MFSKLHKHWLTVLSSKFLAENVWFWNMIDEISRWNTKYLNIWILKFPTIYLTYQITHRINKKVQIELSIVCLNYLANCRVEAQAHREPKVQKSKQLRFRFSATNSTSSTRSEDFSGFQVVGLWGKSRWAEVPKTRFDDLLLRKGPKRPREMDPNRKTSNLFRKTMKHFHYFNKTYNY